MIKHWDEGNPYRIKVQDDKEVDLIVRVIVAVVIMMNHDDSICSNSNHSKTGGDNGNRNDMKSNSDSNRTATRPSRSGRRWTTAGSSGRRGRGRGRFNLPIAGRNIKQ